MTYSSFQTHFWSVLMAMTWHNRPRPQVQNLPDFPFLPLILAQLKLIHRISKEDLTKQLILNASILGCVLMKVNLKAEPEGESARASQKVKVA